MEKRLKHLLAAVADEEQITILLHDDPDPDAIAAAAGLRYLLHEKRGVWATIAYRGIIGRAENRAMVDYLQVPLQVLAEDEPLPAGGRALIDTQPGAGNSPIGEDDEVHIVIDHHGDIEAETATFSDVRPWIGASATIATQYLRAADLRPATRLATALFYGIKTDTKALSRDTSAADVTAYFYLLQFADVDALVNIENAQVPPAYFRNLTTAMQAASVYNGVVLSYIGKMDYPDLAAEIADMLLRLEGITWAVCLGYFDDDMHLSVRARDENANANAVAQAIIGDAGSAGGRNTLAGGQMPLKGHDPQALAEEVHERALQTLNVPADIQGHPLV